MAETKNKPCPMARRIAHRIYDEIPKAIEQALVTPQMLAQWIDDELNLRGRDTKKAVSNV